VFGELLLSVYQHLPVVVLQLTMDGMVLNMNPEAVRVLGYAERELAGKNFWSVLFPGRLFAQVPRFMSAADPMQQFARDVPMTVRTKDGRDRVLAWTRHVQNGTGSLKMLLCMGVDLTDRLTTADLAAATGRGQSAELPEPTVMGVGNGGTVDSETVTPIAITPPAAGSPAVAIAQVHEFLTEVAVRVEALQAAYARGEMEQLAGIAETLGQGAYACGLLGFSARAERLHVAASGRALGEVTALVKEIAALVQHGGAAGSNEMIG
jgi:PAS domain S-box-containing protein